MGVGLQVPLSGMWSWQSCRSNLGSSWPGDHTKSNSRILSVVPVAQTPDWYNVGPPHWKSWFTNRNLIIIIATVRSVNHHWNSVYQLSGLWGVSTLEDSTCNVWKKPHITWGCVLPQCLSWRFSSNWDDSKKDPAGPVALSGAPVVSCFTFTH